MNKPRVGILTSLCDWSPAYSLTGIILSQAQALHRAGYEYDILCLKSFNKADKSLAVVGPWHGNPDTPLNVRYCLPQTQLHDYQWNESARPDFDEQVDTHFFGVPDKEWVGYKEAIEPYDVVITHDLMVLSWYLPCNQAIRRCVELYPGKRWLHFFHSAPSGLPREQPPYPSSLRFQGCANSLYVYLNHRQRQDVANHLQIKTRDIAVVYNPKDPRDLFNFSSETCRLIHEHKILDHDILQVYPFSTPRWRAKGVHKLLRVWGFWRKTGLNAKLVLVNAHCTQEKDEVQVRAMEDYARKCGLTPGLDVVWTSRFASEREREPGGDHWKAWRYSVPSRTVRELGLISNVFLFPSDSECCSLIQAEAAVSGKLLVLNRNCQQMLEFADANVLSYEFANDPDRNPVYYECLARELWSEMQRDASLMTATRARTSIYNRDVVFKQQLEPLLYQGRL